MHLCKLQEFRRCFYTPDSAPSLSTLRARIERGTQTGGIKLDGRYYIDLDEFDRQTNLHAKLVAQRDALLLSNPALRDFLTGTHDKPKRG